MARIESIKTKLHRLNISVVIISIVVIFVLQLLLNILEFSNIGQSLYHDFWHQPHYLFTISSICINLFIPLIVIYMLTRFFYKKHLSRNIDYLNHIIKSLKSDDIDLKVTTTNIKEFNDVINEVQNINTFLKKRIADQLTIQNNFKKKLEIFEHDLKTPLTVMQGHIELLKKINNSELPNQEIKSKINSETKVILNALERINNQIKLHINNVKLLPNHSDKINIEKVISTINESYNNKYILKDKTMDIQVDNKLLHNHIFLNNQILYHVIDNLINNALKYANKELSINFKCLDQRLLQFSVINDGKQFTEDELKFAKEWGVKGKASNGSGIGLYFANEVIKQYNSEIILENIENKAKVSFIVDISKMT